MYAVAMVAVVAGLVWGAVVFARGGLLAGCLMVLLAGACFSWPFLDVPVGPVSMTLDRLVWAALMAQYAFWRWSGRADPKPIGRPEAVLLAFVGVMVLSTFTADWRADGCDPLTRLVIFYVMPLGVYWVARQSKFTERSVLRIFACLAVFGVYLAVTSIAETRQWWWLVYPKYIVATIQSTDLEFIGRGRGPLLNPVPNGMVLVLCLVSALLWWPRLRRPGQLMLLAVSLLFAAAIFCTMTRSVWMGAFLSVGLVLALTLPRQWRMPVLGGGALLVAAIVATQWDHLVEFKRDRDLTAQQTADSVHLRPVLARVAWNMFVDRPILGCGFCQYPEQSTYYLADRSTSLVLEKARGYEPHNVLFSLLTETGLVGFGLFVLLLWLWGRDAWRLWQRRDLPLWARQQGMLFLVVLVVYLVNGMFHDTSVAPLAHLTLFFTAGVTAGLRPLLRPAPQPRAAAREPIDESPEETEECCVASGLPG